MRKIFKKAITAVASLAMMVGMVAGMPAMDAKAGNLVARKNIYVSVPTGTNDVAIHIWSGANFGSAASGAGSFSWAKAMNKVQDGLFVIEADIYDNFGNGLQVGIVDTNAEYKSDSSDKPTYFSDIKSDMIDPSKTDVWLEVVGGSDYTIKTCAPVSITASDADIAANVETKIDAALALAATTDNKAAYDAALAAYNGLTDAQKAYVPASKLTSLNAGISTIQAAIDAENAAAAGKVTIYVQNTQNWEKVTLYSWKDSTEFFGGWPGKSMTACEKNAGWYSATFDITAATSFIFSNNDNGEQTANIEGVVAGTYWYVINKNDDGTITATASTTAPSGWVDEAAAEIVPDGNNDNADGNGQQAPTTADATPVAAAVAAVVLMGMAVVVLNTKKADR